MKKLYQTWFSEYDVGTCVVSKMLVLSEDFLMLLTLQKLKHHNYCEPGSTQDNLGTQCALPAWCTRTFVLCDDHVGDTVAIVSDSTKSSTTGAGISLPLLGESHRCLRSREREGHIEGLHA